MTKKLVGLLAVALFGISTLSANTACALTSGVGTNTVTATANGQQATFSGGVFTCSFTIPAGNVLNSVSLTINDSFQLATAGQTNTLQFTYAIAGFNGTTGLTTTVSSAANGINGGVSPDSGNITGETPGAIGSQCTKVDSSNYTCTEAPPLNGPTAGVYSFTVTGSSSWLQGNLISGGSDAFSVSFADTYSPPVATPEPATLLMIGGGLIGLALVGRRKFHV